MKKWPGYILLLLAVCFISNTEGQCSYLSIKRSIKQYWDDSDSLYKVAQPHIDDFVDKIKNYLCIDFCIYIYDDGNDRNAFASKSNEIFIGKGLIRDCLHFDSSFLCLDYVICHEASHLFQYKDSSNHSMKRSPVKNFELQADCMASRMIYDLKKLRDTEKFQIMLDYLFTLGDYSFNSPEHHGVPMQRYIAAFGYWSIYCKDAIDLYNKSRYLFEPEQHCQVCPSVCHYSIVINRKDGYIDSYCIGVDLNIYNNNGEDGYGNETVIKGKVIPSLHSTMKIFTFEINGKNKKGKKTTMLFYVKNNIVYKDKHNTRVAGNL